jgi:hypothetical protein
MIANNLLIYLTNSSATLPSQKEVKQSVAEILQLFAQGEGATYSLYFGEVGNQPLYAVSVYPERGRKIPGKNLGERLIQSFVRQNLELLGDPRNCVGIWFDAESGTTYLDISTTLPDKEEALRLGQEYNQIGIYDFTRAEVIETGGTGEEIAELPPIDLRLPTLERSEQYGSDHGNGNSDGT